MAREYRAGEKSDCAKLAELISIASDGVVEYLFRDLLPGMTPVQVVAHSLENDDYPHSFRSAVVATDKNDIVGVALSYPSSYHRITDEMRSFFPPERLEHLRDFYSSRVEKSWYLDTLGVDEGFRRRGIGTKLVELTKEKAKENGFGILSLIVFAENAPALSLYKRLGFAAVEQVNLEANEFIRHENGCVLLQCDIAS